MATCESHLGITVNADDDYSWVNICVKFFFINRDLPTTVFCLKREEKNRVYFV